MRIKVAATCQVYWNYRLVDLAKDDEVDGQFAAYLASTGAPVKVLEADPEPEPEQEQEEEQEKEPAPDPSVGDGDPGDNLPAPNPEDNVAGDQVPDELDIEASSARVLAWVGDDPDRALVALEAESDRDNPRVTLLPQLQKIADEG